MAQPKIYSRRIRREAVPKSPSISLFGRVRKLPKKLEPSSDPKVTVKATQGRVVIPKGPGIALWKLNGVIEHVDGMSLQDLLALHRLLFRRTECHKRLATNIVLFNGWEDEIMQNEFRSNLSKHKLEFMERICKLVSLPTGDNKDTVLDTLSQFFICPYQPTRNYVHRRDFVQQISPQVKQAYRRRPVVRPTKSSVPPAVVEPAEKAKPQWAVPVVSIRVIFGRMRDSSRQSGSATPSASSAIVLD